MRDPDAREISPELWASLHARTGKSIVPAIVIIGPSLNKSDWFYKRFLEAAQGQGHEVIQHVPDWTGLKAPKMEFAIIDELSTWFPRVVKRWRGKKFVIRRTL